MNALHTFKIALFAAAAAAACAGTAQAAQITGSLEMSNVPFLTSVRVLDAGGQATNDFNLGVKLDFSPNYAIPNGAAAFGTGDLAKLFPIVSAVSIQDVTYKPFSGPIDNFFYITNLAHTLRFDLNGLTASVVRANGSETLSLFGTGMMQIAGYDDTPGTWTFSTQHSLTSSNTRLTWSASTAAVPVPVPGALALLGAGLVGLGSTGVLRKRKAQA